MNNLKNTLLANASFSFVTGMLLLFLHSQIAIALGIDLPMLLLVIGITLIGFAALVGYTAIRKPINNSLVKFIVVQDCAWVVGSILIVGFQLFTLTTIGYWLIAIVAIPVTVFAWLQNRYAKVVEH